MTYDIVFLTTWPSFYKINLYNEIAKHRKIFVIFVIPYTANRKDDFFVGEKDFDYKKIDKGNRFKKTIAAIRLIKRTDYKSLVISGWESLSCLVAAFISPKSKNAVVVESSIYESKTSGLKAFIKRIFLSRISIGLPTGISGEALLRALGFRRRMLQTHGVGIYNRVPKPELRLLEQNATNFLYVGRLSPEKNLKRLIEVFNDMPEFRLSIVGFGPQEEELRPIAKPNTSFLGPIPNKDLPAVYQRHDVFILPSYSETWGLVVEEALNNGIPVALSTRVGASDDFVKERGLGVLFDPYDLNSMKKAICHISDMQTNNRIRQEIAEIDFQEIENSQIDTYLHLS